MITFNPETHIYIDEKGNEYISVTTLLKNEFPFDAEKIADSVRKYASSPYFGMSTQRIIQLWENSADHGDIVHSAIEKYIKEKTMPEDISLIPLVEQFKKLSFKGSLLSEEIIWDDTYRIAGTADILECVNNEIFLFDIKTSNRITDDKLIKFSVQMELYRRMIEKQFNKSAKSIAILHYEDYVIKRSKTKLKLIRPLNVNNIVDKILKKRKEEVEKIN